MFLVGKKVNGKKVKGKLFLNLWLLVSGLINIFGSCCEFFRC